MSTSELLALLTDVRARGIDRWIVRCVAHEDRLPSLTMREIHDRILLHCMAGCAVEDVCGAIGITFADVHANPHGRPERGFLLLSIIGLMKLTASRSE